MSQHPTPRRPISRVYLSVFLLCALMLIAVGYSFWINAAH